MQHKSSILNNTTKNCEFYQFYQKNSTLNKKLILKKFFETKNLPEIKKNVKIQNKTTKY